MLVLAPFPTVILVNMYEIKLNRTKNKQKTPPHNCTRSNKQADVARQGKLKMQDRASVWRPKGWYVTPSFCILCSDDSRPWHAVAKCKPKCSTWKHSCMRTSLIIYNCGYVNSGLNKPWLELSRCRGLRPPWCRRIQTEKVLHRKRSVHPWLIFGLRQSMGAELWGSEASDFNLQISIQ